MPIKMWINGYYRSGTTILWHMVRQSKPEGIHLYELFHPKLYEQIYEFYNRPDPLHGIRLRDDYFKLPSRVLDEILETSHKLDGSPPTIDEVQNIIDLLNDLNQSVYVKTVRGCLILPYVIDNTKAKVIHIHRCPVCVWLAHFTEKERQCEGIVTGTCPTFDYDNRFYLRATFEKLKKTAGVKYNPTTYLDMFAFNYFVTTYHVLNHTQTHPDLQLLVYESLTNLDLALTLGVKPKVAKMFTPNKIQLHHDLVYAKLEGYLREIQHMIIYKSH